MALKVIAYPIQISVHEAAGRFSAGSPVDRMLAPPPKTLSEILLFLSREKTERQGQVLNHNFEISQGLLSISLNIPLIFFNYQLFLTILSGILGL